MVKQKGTTTVEFALGALVMMIATFAIFESCYQIYVVNMTEYALRETIRNTKIYEGHSDHEQYEAKFKTLVEDQENLWHFLIDSDKFSIEGMYYPNYNDFVAGYGHASEGLGFDYDLAELTVTYRYTPILNLWGASESLITRTMVLNLEHEGWEDEEE
jgi:tight adherence protein E